MPTPNSRECTIAELKWRIRVLEAVKGLLLGHMTDEQRESAAEHWELICEQASTLNPASSDGPARLGILFDPVQSEPETEE